MRRCDAARAYATRLDPRSNAYCKIRVKMNNQRMHAESVLSHSQTSDLYKFRLPLLVATPLVPLRSIHSMSAAFYEQNEDAIEMGKRVRCESDRDKGASFPGANKFTRGRVHSRIADESTRGRVRAKSAASAQRRNSAPALRLDFRPSDRCQMRVRPNYQRTEFVIHDN